MADLPPGRIGVIADTSLQRHVLQRALSANGYRVVFNSDPAQLDEADLQAVEADLWLVDLVQTEDSPLVDALLERDDCPVLFGEGHAPERQSEHYPRWERRLLGKLKRLVGDPSVAVGPRLRSEEHTSELQSRENLVCRLLLEKKNFFNNMSSNNQILNCNQDGIFNAKQDDDVNKKTAGPC